MRVRHGDIGGRLEVLLRDHGLRVDDVVIESSRGYAIGQSPVDAEAVVARAVQDARCDRAVAMAWVEEQHHKSRDGTFRASWKKVLVVATKKNTET